MLVDDNADILFTLSVLARSLTMAAIECHPTPEAALAAFLAAPEHYELVITDLEMPGMDGMELCRGMRAVSSHQKMLLATGNGSLTAAAARSAGFDVLLKKPILLASLEAALAEVGLRAQAGGSAPSSADFPLGTSQGLSSSQPRNEAR